MPKSKKYWQDRIAALEDERYQSSEKYYKDLQEQFRRATNLIQMDIERWYKRIAENNGISYAAAKQFLKESELEEFKWTLEQYIEIGEVNVVSQEWIKELENASAKYHISYLEAMKLQIQQHNEVLATQYEKGITDYLNNTYSDTFYKTAFEVAKGTGVGTNLAEIDTKRIDTIIRKPWAQDGANFSDRIWNNKDKLVTKLHTELSQNIIRGEDPAKAINNMSKAMNVSKSQAGTLVMTETAAISSAATKDCYNELDVERYEILATLDLSTSSICRELDGKVFEMKDYEVGVTAHPFHPNCRTTEIPYFDDEFTEGETRAARGADGKTYQVPANMKYNEWHDKFVKGNPEAELAEKKIKNLSADKKQYENYSKLLGEYTPKSLNEFQNIKYTNEYEYGVLKAQAKGMSYYNKAVLNEPEITKQVKEVAESVGMDTMGLEYRVKERDSYLRKIRTNYKPNANEYEINDILRYTYGVDATNLSDNTLKSIDKYSSLGYNTIKIKNSWNDEDNPYKGINTIIQSPSGQKFELQYHTQESFDLKNGKLHELYEKQRLINDEESEEFISLRNQMFLLSDKLNKPNNIERVK